MKINFHKSEIVHLDVEEKVVHDIVHILACSLAGFPVK
jgi:hypothetical protein